MRRTPVHLAIMSLAIGALWLAPLARGAAPADPARPDTILFEFAPPDSLDFRQTLVMTREKRTTDGWRQVDHSTITTDVSLRAGDDGYTLVHTPGTMTATRDGKPVLDPIMALFQDLVVTYFVDAEGNLQDVQGLDGLVERAGRLLPPDVARALEPALNEETLLEKERSEWNGRIADFVGALVVVGDSVASELPYALPNGQTLTYFTRLHVTGWRDTPIGPRLQLDTIYDSDARSLDTFLSGLGDRVMTAVGADSLVLEFAGSRVSGASRRLIDPATMLIHSEVATRTMSFTATLPGKGVVPLIVREERRYSYDYSPVQEDDR